MRGTTRLTAHAEFGIAVTQGYNGADRCGLKRHKSRAHPHRSRTTFCRAFMGLHHFPLSEKSLRHTPSDRRVYLLSFRYLLLYIITLFVIFVNGLMQNFI